MIHLNDEELRMLSYAITFARSSDKTTKAEQDTLSEVMVKVHGEIMREGPHYLVGGAGQSAELSEKEARRLRELRLNRVRQNRLRRPVAAKEES